MYIIQQSPGDESGYHLIQGQSHRMDCWLEGYLELPEHLVDRALACRGCCDLVIQNGILVDITEKTLSVMDRSPSAEEDLEALIVDHEYRLTLLELEVI